MLKETLYILLFSTTLLFGCSSPYNGKDNDIYRREIAARLSNVNNEDSLKDAISVFISGNDDIGAIIAYKELGKYYRENSMFSKALAYHEDGLAMALKSNDTTEIIQALNNIGTDYRRLGELTKASDYHYRALQYAETHSARMTQEGRKNLAISMNGIGNISLTMEYYDDAEEYFRRALNEEIALQSHVGQAINYANIGAIFEYREQYDSSRIYYLRSMEQNNIAGSDLGIGLCHTHLGDLCLLQGRYDDAKEEFLASSKIMAKISDKWHWLNATVALAKVNLLTKNAKEFKQYVAIAEQTACEIKSNEHLIEIYMLKEQYESELGNYLNALNYYKRAISLQDSLKGTERTNSYLELKINYEKGKSAKYIQNVEEQNKTNEKAKHRWIALALSIVFVLGPLVAILVFAYRQRSRSNKVLKEFETKRSEFLANISHEFRTPLTVMQEFNRIITNRNDLSEKEKSAYLKSIQRHIENLLELVNRLMESANSLRPTDIDEKSEEKIEASCEQPESGEEKTKLFMEKVNDIIESQIDNPSLGTSLVADKMAMSVSQLNRKINSITNTSTISYIQKYKLEKASQLLKTTAIPISEVAIACGFQDGNYFARLFKREYGVTPTQYQKNWASEK